MTNTNMAPRTWLILITLLITLIIMIPRSTSQPTYLYSICPNTTLFANNSQYHTNLNTLFQTLSSNATANLDGFYYTSVDDGSNDAVYGLFLCRGDQNTTSCRDCVANATSDLANTDCPNARIGTTWYDECMVRYSNVSFLGNMSQTPRFRLMNTQNITGNITDFMESIESMMNDVAVRASNGEPRRKFSTGIARYSSLQTMYGLGQCTPDLSASDCNECLMNATRVLPISVGGRTIGPSCNVRYEIYPFFNGAANVSQSLPPPATTDDSSGQAPGLSPPTGSGSTSTRLIIAIVVPVATVSLALLVLCLCLFNKRKAKKHATNVVLDSKGEDLSTAESLQYDLQTLKSATNNFSDGNKLGEGGFGGVYKGTQLDGEEIAVKRLSKSSTQGIQEFKNEVMLVAKLQHRNLVRLLGFCLEGEEKLLVYEYVPNKSLDKFLFDDEKKGQLDWGMRYKIIQGIARGMLYLHQDSQLTIIHRDLKTSNILLDANMNPKISDFGMAKIFGVDQTEGNTSKIFGTYGYMSPEYAMHGQFSVKSDVYSFGVLVLEIISGKRNSEFYETGYAEDLLNYAWSKWIERVPLEFVDPAIRDSLSTNEVLTCIHLGLLCVQESTDERPTMATVVLTLDDKSVTLPVPQQPAFSTKIEADISVANVKGTARSSSKSVTWSVNDASITEVEPR